MDPTTIGIVWRVVVCLGVIGAIARWRGVQSPQAIKTTLDGAKLALGAAAEWAKWMAGVQTATIAGLAWLLGQGGSAIRSLTGYPLTFAVAAFMFSGAGLFCSAWILAATSSILIRVHAVRSPEPHRSFDVHEMGILAAWSLRLGNVMAVQHLVWSLGLVSFALFVLSR